MTWTADVLKILIDIFCLLCVDYYLQGPMAVVSRMEAYAPKGVGDSSVADSDRQRVHNVNMSAERNNRRPK